MAIGLLILRVVVGLTLAAHGAQKLVGWFGGYGLNGTGGFLEQLGFIPGRRHALFAGLAEGVGGLLLALGLATPLAAAVVIAVMTVASVSVHLKHGFFNHNQGYEYTMTLAVVALSMAFTGPGALSLDAALGVRAAGPAWGIAAAVLGLGGAAVQLAGRRAAVTQEAQKAS
jgi:putative oxidoreductase